MRCPLSFLFLLGALSRYRSALGAPVSNTTPSTNESQSVGVPLPPEGHPYTSLQLRSVERTRFEAGKVIHNCLHVMIAGWMADPPHTIRATIQISDSLKAWSQAVRVTPAPDSPLPFTTKLFAYAAGDIIDDLWSRYAEEATVFSVCQYRIVDRSAPQRAIADWDFVQLPPPGNDGSSDSSDGPQVQYLSNNRSSSSSSSNVDDQAAVAVTKRQDIAGDISSTNSTNTAANEDYHFPLTLPADPCILVRFKFSDSQQHLNPKSLLILPAQILRNVIFRYRPRSTVASSGFNAGVRWTMSRLSYTGRHCVRLTVLNASVAWMDFASAMLAVIPPTTEQNRWDAFVAEFSQGDQEVTFARVEAFEGDPEAGGCDSNGGVGRKG